MALSVKEYKTRIASTLREHVPSLLERALDEGVVLKDPQPRYHVVTERVIERQPSREPLCLVCGEETIPWARHTGGTGSLDDDWLCKDCYQTSQRKSREPWWLPLARYLVR